MKKKRAKLLILAGALLVLAAAGRLTAYSFEEDAAGRSAQALLTVLTEEIRRTEVESVYEPEQEEQPEAAMPQTTLAGYDLVGVVRVPEIGLELPVLDEWDYELLKIAPCRYSGSAAGQDLILMGHNYKNHFKPIKKVSVGEKVEFCDVRGVTHFYTVTQTQELDKYELDELTSGDHDLTLFTCTGGGKRRFVVRCAEVTA